MIDTPPPLTIDVTYEDSTTHVQRPIQTVQRAGIPFPRDEFPIITKAKVGTMTEWAVCVAVVEINPEHLLVFFRLTGRASIKYAPMYKVKP